MIIHDSYSLSDHLHAAKSMSVIFMVFALFLLILSSLAAMVLVSLGWPIAPITHFGFARTWIWGANHLLISLETGIILGLPAVILLWKMVRFSVSKWKECLYSLKERKATI